MNSHGDNLYCSIHSEDTGRFRFHPFDGQYGRTGGAPDSPNAESPAQTGGVCAGRNSEFRLKRSNAIEAGGLRKPFDASEWVKGPIGIDGKYTDGTLTR
jgi:hypothetical protein